MPMTMAQAGRLISRLRRLRRDPSWSAEQLPLVREFVDREIRRVAAESLASESLRHFREGMRALGMNTGENAAHVRDTAGTGDAYLRRCVSGYIARQAKPATG